MNEGPLPPPIHSGRSLGEPTWPLRDITAGQQLLFASDGLQARSVQQRRVLVSTITSPPCCFLLTGSAFAPLPEVGKLCSVHLNRGKTRLKSICGTAVFLVLTPVFTRITCVNRTFGEINFNKLISLWQRGAN